MSVFQNYRLFFWSVFQNYRHFLGTGGFSREGEEGVAVVFVLLLAGFDFCRETGGEVSGEGLEAVEDGDYAILLREGWDGEKHILEFSHIN